MKSKLLVITSFIKPVPDVKGGAVETLLTSVIINNEKYNNYDITIISMFDIDAKKTSEQFKKTKFFYIDPNKKSFDYFCYLLFDKIIKRFIYNKKNKKHVFKRRDISYFSYKCLKICKKVKPSLMLVENYDELHRLWPLIEYIGFNNCFYHLHYCRKTKLSECYFIPNIISVSEFALKCWTKDITIPHSDYVLLNGVDNSIFNDKLSSEEKLTFRKTLGLTKDDFVVLFTGRIVSYKGVKELISSIKNLDNPNIKLVLLGEIMMCDSESDFKKFFNYAVKHYNFLRYIGFVNNSDLSYYYQISDVQVVPSTCQEGAPLSAIEGMLCFLPLVVTKSGGIPEYVDDNCSIMLDIDESLTLNLSKAILRLYNDRMLLFNMRKNLKTKAKIYTAENYYKNLVKILKKTSD